MSDEVAINIKIPKSLMLQLEETRNHLNEDLQPGERIPSIEELIVDAVAEAYGSDEGRCL